MKVFGFHSVSNEVEKASDMLSTWFSLIQIQLSNNKDNDNDNETIRVMKQKRHLICFLHGFH